MKRRNTGLRGEKLATDFLRKKGYRILETNYRCPEGEIDIVARHKDSLVFIEVRAKTSMNFGSPEESITAAKKTKMRTTAAHYRQKHHDLPPQWRIDVVAVELSPVGKLSRIEHITNAVGED